MATPKKSAETIPGPPILSSRPTRPAPDVLAASRSEPTYPPPNETTPTSETKILVVDDDPAIRESLVEVLTDEGYLVWQAQDGWEALKRVFEMPRVDLILLDIWMPKVTGDEFLEVYDKSPMAGAPVIIISAGSPPVGGYDDRFIFMRKPLDLDTLLATVRRHIVEGREAVV